MGSREVRVNVGANPCPLTGLEGRLVATRDGADLAAALARLGAAPPEPLRRKYYAVPRRRWHCARSGLTWFEPAIVADGDFYEHLARELPWYYSGDRWDQRVALELLRAHGARDLLEIGCGPGAFLRAARARGLAGRGLELNATAAAAARAEGLDVTTDETAAFAAPADALVLLQVLEHLPDPLAVLKNWIRRARPRLLLVAVPASDTLLGRLGDPLVWPPHHLTLWSRRALRRLGRALDATLLAEAASPLDWASFRRALANEPGGRLRGLPPLSHPLRLRLVFELARLLRLTWARRAHTRLALYLLPAAS